MAKNGNGALWKIIAVLIGLVITAGGWIWSASGLSKDVTHNRESIETIKPQVDINKMQCQEFKYKIDRLDEKITEQSKQQENMLKLQQMILDEVRK